MTSVPPWLTAMRAITGLTETPGSADNPNILKMRDFIAEKFPEQKAYADLYQHDDTPWCGLTTAYVMAECEPPISGPFDLENSKGDQDECWMWALSWANDPNYIPLDAPRLGCVVVMERSGGGHVTLYESDDGSNIKCRGGNQGDMVNVSSYPKNGVVGYFWPKDGGPIPPAERREISRGDTGSDVAHLQRSLGLPDDGDFGPVTESGVKAFQGACGLAKDGVVGPMTWEHIDELDARMAAGDDGISDELSEQIDNAAAASPANSHSWPDRGRSPPGYLAGMGKVYAVALMRLEGGDEAAEIMAQADSDDEDTDALTWYREEFEDEGMSNHEDGAETLRHLFVLMIGLGMRESSGNSWEGRDMSASNVASDTAEAGLFQTSWNIRSCATPEMEGLLEEYWADPNGFRPTFTEGLSPTSSQLDCYGSGDGARYQWLARYSPAFAALVTGVGLRRLRQHWGPINRKEVTILPAVDDFLIDVERLMDMTPTPEPEPEPGEPSEVKVSIVTKGNVIVTVDQVNLGESRSARLQRERGQK